MIIAISLSQQYKGCFADNMNSHDLGGYVYGPSATLTIEACILTCQAFSYAGLQNKSISSHFI